MNQSIGHIAFLVRDYDEAIAYFTAQLGFELIEDSPQGEGKRWVLVAPPGASGTSLLLAKAVTPEQIAAIGHQAGGRVFLFLHTDDFWRDYHAMQSRGVVVQGDAAHGAVRDGRGLRRPLRQQMGPHSAHRDYCNARSSVSRMKR